MPANSWKLPPGPHNVGSYQISGTPYITGSAALKTGHEDRVTFPNITRAVTVFNHGAQTLRVHFNTTSSAPSAGVSGEPWTVRDNPGSANVVAQYHFMELTGGLDAGPLTASVTMNVKCAEIYVSCAGDAGTSGAYKVFAELTNIPATMMGALTGSGLTE